MIAVLIGVGIASWPGNNGAAAAVAAVEPVYLAVCAASFVFPALATIVKEHIFKSTAQQLGGKQLDVLIVNAYCSTSQVSCKRGAAVAVVGLVSLAVCAARVVFFALASISNISYQGKRLGSDIMCCSLLLLLLLQAAFVLLMLPITCQLKGLTLSELPTYLKAGATCLMGGAPTCGADCAGAPLLPVLYVAVNVVSRACTQQKTCCCHVRVVGGAPTWHSKLLTALGHHCCRCCMWQ